MTQLKSVYRQGAENGISFGVYLTVLFMSLCYGFRIDWLLLVYVVMLLGLPVMLLSYMVKHHNQLYRMSSVSDMWMLGIVTSICGALVCAFVVWAWMQLVSPTMFSDLIANVAEMAKAQGNSQQVELLEQAVSTGALPHAPIEVAMQLFWIFSFFGSTGSLVLAAIVKAVVRPKK